MKIAPADTKLQRLPELDSSRYPGEHERKQECETFGEVLAAAMGRGLEREHDRPVAIGEDAVRFDARPIIGRALAMELPVETSHPVKTEMARPVLPTTDTPEFERGPALSRAIALAAPRIAALVSEPATSQVAAPVPADRPAASAKAGVAEFVEPLAPTIANRRLASEGAAPSVPPLPDAANAGISADVSLALLADEVLVTVRGLDLSAEEEETLADEARRLLASSDFGGRLLRVVTSRRT